MVSGVTIDRDGAEASDDILRPDIEGVVDRLSESSDQIIEPVRDVDNGSGVASRLSELRPSMSLADMGVTCCLSGDWFAGVVVVGLLGFLKRWKPDECGCAAEPPLLP